MFCKKRVKKGSVAILQKSTKSVKGVPKGSVIYSWGAWGGETNSWGGGGPKLGGDLKNFFACGGHSN